MKTKSKTRQLSKSQCSRKPIIPVDAFKLLAQEKEQSDSILLTSLSR